MLLSTRAVYFLSQGDLDEIMNSNSANVHKIDRSFGSFFFGDDSTKSGHARHFLEWTAETTALLCSILVAKTWIALPVVKPYRSVWFMADFWPNRIERS